MSRHLFFLCPTDFLEPVINEVFGCGNTYLTSLGNSIAFDSQMTFEVNEMLRTRDIRNISFVLSDNNRIISDALGDKTFSHIVDLKKFYRNIERQKRHCEEVWSSDYHQFLISSYFLNHKLMQLRAQLNDEFKTRIHLSAKIYKRKDHIFRDICSFSIVRHSMALN